MNYTPSEIKFRKESNESGISFVTPYINKVAFHKIVENFEIEKGYLDPSGGYAGLVPEYYNHGPMLEHFLGQGDRSTNKTYLLGCECGEVGCWPLLGEISKIGTIAGSYVLEGIISRNAKVRLIRDGIVIYNGKLATLKRFKDDVKEVKFGYECGIALEKFNDLQIGDQFEAYHEVEVAKKLK